MLKATSFLGLLLMGFLPFLSGCDSSTDTTVNQQILAMAWLPDESGLLGLVERTTVSQVDNTSITTTDLFHINLDGSLGNKISTQDESYMPGYPSIIFVTSDGHTAITEIGLNIYRVDLTSGNSTIIIPNTYLVGVSRDGKYVITTFQSPSVNNPPPTALKFYDITTSPIRLLSQQPTITAMFPEPLFSLDSNRFAITRNDTVGRFIAITDSTGTIYLSIGNASVPISGRGFISPTHDLFFETNQSTVQKYNLSSGVRVEVIPAKDTMESFDVSSDGTLLVYSTGGTANPFQLRAHNLANGDEATITSDANQPLISPRGDRVAYTNNTAEVIRVSAVSLPQ